MKKGQASQTADLAAAWRAAESQKPENERVCYDPYAKCFLGGMYSLLGKSRLLTKIAMWYSDKVGPGASSNKVLSTRYIDDRLKACIDDGIKQLVILGAGYDTRAYRFKELRGRVKVFEVDHPDTQRAKIEKVKKVFGTLPEYVVYVPVDFEKERLDRRLFESGYKKDLKTLFIWEAVTSYITPQAVDETLAFVANNSGEGSSIVFDYIYKSVVDGTCERKGAKESREALARRGEAYRFGIEEGTIQEFLPQRGFLPIEIANGEFLKNAYFKGKNENRVVLQWVEYVHAKVKPREHT
jgi:methyltransferase (TIGR00027 family)